MQEKNLYEYAVLRFVPSIEREEFVNVGLVMMCKRRRWIKLDYVLDPRRLGAFPSELCAGDLEPELEGFRRIADGDRAAGPIAEYPVEERFRWLTAAKSACLQTSRPHPGLTDDLDATFARLYAELVL